MEIKSIFCSFDITGSHLDRPRAEAIQASVNGTSNQLAVVPFLLFGESLILPGDKRQTIQQMVINIMSSCDEVMLFDSPETSVTCLRDKCLCEELGKPYRLSGRNDGLQDRSLADIMQYYQQTIGGFPSNNSLYDISEFLAKGAEAELIKNAISIGVEKRKSWSYIAAIIKNRINSGVFTMEQYKLENAKRQSAKNGDNIARYDLDAYKKSLDELPE